MEFEEMAVNNELIERAINEYMMLQRIKAANHEENAVLDYEMKRVEVILHSFGVNTDDLKM